MIDLLLATRNVHKTREVRNILGEDFAVRDLRSYPHISDPDETGVSFEENATLKALAVSKVWSGFVAADDSGLEVDALEGAPGIYSARYAGPKASETEKIRKLLRGLAQAGGGNEPRRARFRCVVALARKGKLVGTFEGIVEGTIAHEPRGNRGFGYDPIFIPEGFKATFGELPAEVKNTISHRAKAISRLKLKLRQLVSRD